MAEPAAFVNPASLRKLISWSLLAFCAALPLSIAALNMAGGALIILLLTAKYQGDRLPWNSALTGFTYALMGYFAVAALTSACGVDPQTSFLQLHKDLHKLCLALVLLMSLRYSQPKRIMVFFAAPLLALSAWGIAQTLTSSNFAIRAHGFVHPVTFGQQLAVAILGAVCLLAKPEDAREQGVSRGALLAFTIVSSAAFFLNDTRGAMLGIIAGLGAVALIDRRARRYAFGSFVFIAAIVALWELWLPTGRSLSVAFKNGLTTTSMNGQLQRLIFWDVAWRVFRDHPWFGVGPGNYKTVYPQYFSGLIEGQRAWGSAHNLYIHQLAERGAIGLAALVCVLGAMLGRAWRRAREHADVFNLWALSATAAFLVMNLTEVSFQNEQLMSLLIFVWAVADARHQRFAD